MKVILIDTQQKLFIFFLIGSLNLSTEVKKHEAYRTVNLLFDAVKLDMITWSQYGELISNGQ